ncbi:uncharacterized protein KIAA0754-like [Pieris napi]|uniref:uncharacterized protein KIAA0754-like n=1 Tax=Pieris napi TaxID=78633 RepID=UPI001FBAF812|nr:uncharacterized protein KIAA0754-like [Pieris napi]
MNINRAGLGEFCVVEWIQGSKAGTRETVSRDLVELQPDVGPGACKVRSPFSNQYSPAVLHFHNDDIKCISMFKLLSTNTAEKNAVVPSDKASRKRQRQRSPRAVQRVGAGHTDLGHDGPRDSTDELRYIVLQFISDSSQEYDPLRPQYACVPRSWIKASTGTSLAAGTSCMVAWPAQMSGAKADMEELGSRACHGCSPSPKWGFRRFNCVHATANYDAGQDWIRTMTKGQAIYSGDPRPAKMPRISDSSRRFTGLQLTNTPLPSISAVVNELHEMSVCHDTDDCSSDLPAPYNTEEFRKLITTYNCIPKRQRPANSVPDHTVAPTPVLDSLANLPYLEPLRSTSIRENSSSAARKSRKTTSFSTSAKVMFHNAPSTYTSEIGSLQRPSVPTPLPPSNLAPAPSIPSFASSSVPTPLQPSNLAPAPSIPSLPPSNLAPAPSIPSLPPSNLAPAPSIPSLPPSNLAPAPSIPSLPPSNLAPAPSIPSFASSSVPTPLQPSNLAPAPSIPSLPPSNLAPAPSIPSVPPSNLAPAPSIPSLPPSNLAPAPSIPSFASSSVPTPLQPSNLAPAPSIPSFASSSVPTPLQPSNLAPAPSIPSFASSSVPTLLQPSNLAPAPSIPSFASSSVPTLLQPSNLAPAPSIPSFASSSVPTLLQPSNLAPAPSIPSFASSSVPTPLQPSNLAPAPSIPSFASTSVPTTIQSTAASVPCSELLSFTSAISLQYVSPATSTPLLPLIPSTSVVTPSQASTSVDHTSTTVSSSIARTTLPKAQSPSTTTRAEPNSSQIITKRQIRYEFINLISKITVLDEDLEKMCTSTVKGIHSSSLKFQESMKPFYNYCLSKNNDVAVEEN